MTPCKGKEEGVEGSRETKREGNRVLLIQSKNTFSTMNDTVPLGHSPWPYTVSLQSDDKISNVCRDSEV